MIPLARRLTEFSPEGQRHERRLLPIKHPEPAEERAATQTLKEAFERGRVAGQLDERQTLALELEEKNRSFDRALEARRAEWIADQAGQFSQQLMTAMTAIEDRLADSIAKILQPFVEMALRRKAVEDFCAAVKEALRDDAESLLKITGPQDLLDAIATQLHASPGKIEFVASGACTVSAQLGATVFETQLARWLATLGGSPQ